jgi:predicted ribosomally synthesized peptide with nif11-like leader
MTAVAEIQRFAKDLQGNEGLKAEVAKLGTDQAAILALANAKGYQFTMADVEGLSSTGELTDEQLAGVAGGAIMLYTDGTTSLSLSSKVIVYKSTKSAFVW